MNNQMNGLNGFCYSSGNQKEFTHYIKLIQFEQLENLSLEFAQNVCKYVCVVWGHHFGWSTPHQAVLNT